MTPRGAVRRRQTPERAAPRVRRGTDAADAVAARRRRLATAAVFVFGVVGMAVLMFISPLQRLFAQNARVAAVRRQEADLTQRNQELSDRIRSLNDDRTVERLAREQFGLVKPGETAYVVIDGTIVTTTTTTPPTSPTTTTPPTSPPVAPTSAPMPAAAAVPPKPAPNPLPTPPPSAPKGIEPK